MTYEMEPIERVSFGVNYRSLTDTRTAQPGQAQDCQDVLPREDGAFYKTYGWERLNATALTGRPVAIKGFAYRGKNPPAADTARTGNFGIANDGADYTRRVAEFSGEIVLTTSTFYFWNHATEAYVSVALPGGVSVSLDPKPSIEFVQENAYIVGWTDFNLRYDPTDRALYLWGWEAAPAVPAVAAAAGGTLVSGAQYGYGVVFFDIYTGEQTYLSDTVFITPSGSNLTVDVTVAAYTGSRHFRTSASDQDTGVVIYRTDPDELTYYFLTTLNPGTTTFSDTGLAVATQDVALQGIMTDEPRFSGLRDFKGRFYALARRTNSTRVYHNELGVKSFRETWRATGFNELDVSEGQVLTALGGTDTTMLVHASRGAYRGSVSVSGLRQRITFDKLPWRVGAIGPRGRLSLDAYEYFISEYGIYRWREGASEPEDIGELIRPLFVDPTSGLCQLTEGEIRELSEVGYDWASNTLRFIFAIGPTATVPNTHLAYWHVSDQYNGDARLGWFPLSADIQAMDLSSVAGAALESDGTPPTSRERSDRLVWGDQNGYIYFSRPGLRRGGLAAIHRAQGLSDASATTTTLPVKETLYTTGDGLTGLRLEVEATDGTVQVREVASNTASTFTVTAAWDTTPSENDPWRVAGIPAFWRSHFDAFGDYHAAKTVLHLYTGLVDLELDDPDFVMNIVVGAGDFPTDATPRRTRTGRLGRNRRKMLVSATGVWFFYEFANSIPDQRFAITDLQREVKYVGRRRGDAGT